MAKRATEIKTKREAMRLLRNITGESTKTPERSTNPSYQHNDFLKAIIEQQKLAQQQEFEHKQKLQQEQQVRSEFLCTETIVSLSEDHRLFDLIDKRVKYCFFSFRNKNVNVKN
jgi:S-methylmethionine-dependent homocysteine/selenocysteine methylase